MSKENSKIHDGGSGSGDDEDDDNDDMGHQYQ
jgi:hypothetical protein